jgi:hypothetical protein
MCRQKREEIGQWHKIREEVYGEKNGYGFLDE